MTTMRIRAKKFLKTIAEKILPILTILFLLTVVWYFFTIYLNSAMQIDKYDKQGISWNISKLVLDTMSQERPKLPAPHQIAEEIWETTVEKDYLKKIVDLSQFDYVVLDHSWFYSGTVLGVVLAVSIVENRAMESSLMPWIIASQTIPILAIAPMIIVVLNSLGFSGLLQALISTYLSFFPIVVGMVKGLRSPDIILVDLMKTYNSTKVDIFFKLRLPASVPFLFTSMKVAIAISLVGDRRRTSDRCSSRSWGTPFNWIVLWSDNPNLVRINNGLNFGSYSRFFHSSNRIFSIKKNGIY